MKLYTAFQSEIGGAYLVRLTDHTHAHTHAHTHTHTHTHTYKHTHSTLSPPSKSQTIPRTQLILSPLPSLDCSLVVTFSSLLRIVLFLLPTPLTGSWQRRWSVVSSPLMRITGRSGRRFGRLRRDGGGRMKRNDYCISLIKSLLVLNAWFRSHTIYIRV